MQKGLGGYGRVVVGVGVGRVSERSGAWREGEASGGLGRREQQ